MMTKRFMLPFLASVAVAALRSFNSPGWKMDGDKIAMKDGNPIWLDGAGNEQTVEGGTISRLNGEAKRFREGKEAAEAALEKFKDIKDPVAALKALETMSNIDQKKLIDSGEVDKVRQEISKNFQTQIDAEKTTNATLKSQLDGLRLNNAFRGSKFVQERVAVPLEMFEATFAKNFKVDGEKIVPYGPDGNPIYSPTRMSEIASFDEAIEKLTETYAHKDAILKAPNHSGSGNHGGGGGSGGKRTVTRAEFAKMNPAQQADISAKHRAGEAQLVD